MDHKDLENHDLSRMISIDDTTVHLRVTDTTNFAWIGQKEIYRWLSAAWLKMHAQDHIMIPVLVGPLG